MNLNHSFRFGKSLRSTGCWIYDKGNHIVGMITFFKNRWLYTWMPTNIHSSSKTKLRAMSAIRRLAKKDNWAEYERTRVTKY